MIKKTATTLLIFVLAITLVACSTLSSLSTSTTATSSSSTPTSADAALQNNLAVGILKLEGTDNAVTSEQADLLLTLWQGVRLLTSDKSSSSLELAALYQQIQESLTDEQVQAIQEVSWTQEEISAYVKSARSTVVKTNSSTTAQTSTSSSSTQMQMGGPGGDMGGGPGGNSDLALISGMSGQTSVIAMTTSTPIASSSTTRSTSGSTASLNAQLANAVIDLLQKRVAA